MGIDFERRGHLAYVTINRPEALNAMTPEMRQDLFRIMDEVHADTTIRVAILTGAGEKSFCAGADLKATIPAATATEGRIPLWSNPRVRWFSEVFTPIVSAINGYCIAGGMEMMLGTDIRVAAEHARFALQEPRWALVPEGGAIVRLPRQIPWARAMEILLTGDQFSAQEALSAGLINKVVPLSELMSTAEAYAERIVRNGPAAVRAIKEVAVRTSGLDLQYGFQLNHLICQPAFATADAKEGLRAFSEKRTPIFKGH